MRPPYLLHFNGINGSTGEPLIPPMTSKQVSLLACRDEWDPNHLAELQEWNELKQEDHMDVIFGSDSSKLEESGWGVIFPRNISPEVRAALAPMLNLRREQASLKNDNYYRELTYRRSESKLQFLARHKVASGPADPEYLPYHLLIVGSPEEIPFEFQYQLDVQYAVGRIYFESVEDYANYALTVAAAEKGEIRRERQVSFFGVANPGDRATQRSSTHLVKPLAKVISRKRQDWKVEMLIADNATKHELLQLLDGTKRPSLLFTASHGLGFASTDPQQLEHQGALLCQDWPGCDNWDGPLSPDHYLAAEHLPGDADPGGLVAFHFACYGAGTPQFDSFSGHRHNSRRQVAPKQFLAKLPQRLLGHSNRTALAIVAHVDQVWSYSFNWPGAGTHLQVFQSALESLLEGSTIGCAMEYFNQRYAELSSDLNLRMEDLKYGAKLDHLSISGLWTANNDARSYIVLGDPATRLATSR